jgi:hypothetical protein
MKNGMVILFVMIEVQRNHLHHHTVAIKPETTVRAHLEMETVMIQKKSLPSNSAIHAN